MRIKLKGCCYEVNVRGESILVDRTLLKRKLINLFLEEKVDELDVLSVVVLVKENQVIINGVIYHI